MKISSDLDLISLIGKKFPAKDILSKTPYFVFADKIDEVPMLCTADLNLNRIRTEVKNGIIIKVKGIG
jgi:hypothetical protein